MGFSKAAALVLMLSLFASASAEIYFDHAVPPSESLCCLNMLNEQRRLAQPALVVS